MISLLPGALGLAILASISPAAITIKSVPSTLGLVSLAVGSTLVGFIGLRTPRAAGILALIVAPVVGLCFLIGHSVAPVDGLLLLPVAVLSPKWATWMWYETAGNSVLPYLAVSLIVAICGAFWLITARRGWRPIARKKLGSAAALVLLSCLLCALTLLLGVIVTARLYAPIGDGNAGEKRPFTRQQSPDQTVFTARVFHVGPWRIAAVRQHFWGLPIGSFKSFAFLTFPAQDGQYFIDGIRSEGLLTRFLPVVAFLRGNRSAELENAETSLRVLRDGDPRSGIRIIGRATRLPADKSIPGVSVSITGPQGTTTVTTDSAGVYDFHGPAGRYSVSLTEQPKEVYSVGRCRSYASVDESDGTPRLSLEYERDLHTGEIWGCTLNLD